MNTTRLSSLLTVLIGVLLLAVPLPTGARATSEPFVDTSCQQASASRLAPPSFISSLPPDPEPDSAVLTFRIAPYEDATHYRWQAIEDDRVLDQHERPEPPSDPQQMFSDAIETSAIATDVQTGSASADASEMVDDLAGREYQVVPESLAHGVWPGELTVKVSAEVCGHWSEPALMSAEVGETG